MHREGLTTLVSNSWPDHSPSVAMIQPPQEAYLCHLRLATRPGKQDRALG